VAGWAGGQLGAQPVASPDRLTEAARARVHTLRIRIQPTWLAEPGACLELDEDDLKVVLRGRRMGPDQIELDREKIRTLHALAIDTSGSMSGQMDYVRKAATTYVESLHPDYERAMLVTFDDSVILHQRATADRDQLVRAVRELRPGSLTALHDGLYYTVQELAAHRERPVLVLLSDGVDSSSFHLREDVLELIDRRPDLSIFTIGFNLPGIGRSRQGGIRKFLWRLAARTNGRYFLVPAGSNLKRVYRRIREMIDNEATLTVFDPDPDTEAGKPKVSSTKDGCRIQVFQGRAVEEDPWSEPIRGSAPELPYEFPVPPDPRYLKDVVNRAYHQADPECARLDPLPKRIRDVDLKDLWRAEIGSDRIRGCALDVTMDAGTLYDPYSFSMPQDWKSVNAFMKTKSRWLNIPVPTIKELPRRPEQLMDSLADFALSVMDDEIERDSRKRPFQQHARPYHDFPGVCHGRTWFDLRPALASALFVRSDYRTWVLDKLREEAERDLVELEQRFRRMVPDSTETAAQLAVLHSGEGRRILQRAETPSARDLSRFLAAWLGDISAHELFVRWEAAGLQAFLADGAAWVESESLFERWRALRRLFFASSYTRTLTLLSPIRDSESDRIGYYRIVLPRAAWYLPRVKGYKRHVGWADMPNDLVPNLPLAHWALERILARRPELASYLRDHRFQVDSLDYELLSRPGQQVPHAVFRNTRVVLVLRTNGGDTASRLTIEADATLLGKKEKKKTPVLDDVRLAAQGDPALVALAHSVETEIRAALTARGRTSVRPRNRTTGTD
jgi:Mg-chelatase subunit ChlD